MSVFASIATIFIENLIAVAGLLGALFMVVEYYRKARNASLLFFAAAFAAMGIGFLVGFVGQLLYVYLSVAIGGSLVLAQKYFTFVSAFFLILATMKAYRIPHRRLLAVITLAVFALIVVYSANTDGISIIQGIPINAMSMNSAALHFLPGLFANLVLLGISGVAYTRGRRAQQRFIAADLFLFRSALVGILVMTISASIYFLNLDGYLWVNFAVLLVQFMLLFFGAVAKGHPDDEVASYPENVINRSLVFKALSVNTALFWVLAFSLVAITATYFVSSLVVERKEVMVRDLRLLVTTHRTQGRHLLQSAEQFASHPAMEQLIETGGPTNMEDVMAALSGLGDGQTASIAVLDAAGTVLYATEDDLDVAGSLKDSSVVEQALRGHSVAGVEHDTTLNIWALRAAAPVMLSDGSVGGVVIGTDAVQTLGLSSIEEFTVSRATGFGYMSSTNELIYGAGKQFDVLTLHTFARRVYQTSIVPGETTHDDLFFVVGVERTDGQPDGFFYIFLSRDTINAEIFQILSVVMIFVTLFVMVVASVLVFSMLIVLRPVRELREAALRIAHADYDLHIEYSKPDELGQLASAFNSMSATIKDRTTHLNEALRQQRDFLNHTVQEMRNPLNIFRWSLEMLRFGDTGSLNKEQLELIEQMNQTNERVRRLVMNLIDASRIEKGALELQREYKNIVDVIDDAAGELSVRIREKNINLHWNRPAGESLMVYADHGRLSQLMMNILSNAVKYTHRNGHIEVVVKEVTESGPAKRPGSYVQVSIEDNGRGIPKNEQAKIFTRFFRAKNVVVEELEGAGLGLYISKRITEMHGGEIWFESKEGEGSTFWFTIPTKKS